MLEKECESLLLAMKKSMSVYCVFSFGEKVSGFGCQVSGVRIEKLEELYCSQGVSRKPEH